MPNRIIKESICTSEDLNNLSKDAEILFYRLIVKADDYGAYFGDERIVKSACFPLKSDDIKNNQVKSWLLELANAGLIYMYEASDGRTYIQFTKWEKHQQVRAKKRKFPVFDETCKNLISDDIKCPRNPIQSNPNTKSESNAKESSARSRFTAPTIEEVSDYCKERKNGIDAQHFLDYYTANGWKVGKNPMKDWKAAVRTWERNGNGKTQFNRPQDGTIAPFTPKELKREPYDLSDMVEWPPNSNNYIPSSEVPKDGY